MVAFCEGLGLDPAAAFPLLEWDRAVRPDAGPRCAALDPGHRRAAAPAGPTPALTEHEQFHIRETVRYLAYRPG